MKALQFYSKVSITKDREYSRSYGVSETLEYQYATFDGKWLELYHNGCMVMRKNTGGKHFHSWEGKEIKQATFARVTKKLYAALKMRMEKIKEENQKALEESKKQWERDFEKAKNILNPMLPAMVRDGIKFVTSCKGSRGCAYYIFNKYNLSESGLTIGLVRDWIRR